MMFSILNSDIKSKLPSIFCKDVVYETLVLIMYNLCIMHGEKTLVLFGSYHSEHIATYCMI